MSYFFFVLPFIHINRSSILRGKTTCMAPDGALTHGSIYSSTNGILSSSTDSKVAWNQSTYQNSISHSTFAFAKLPSRIRENPGCWGVVIKNPMLVPCMHPADSLLSSLFHQHLPNSAPKYMIYASSNLQLRNSVVGIDPSPPFLRRNREVNELGGSEPEFPNSGPDQLQSAFVQSRRRSTSTYDS